MGEIADDYLAAAEVAIGLLRDPGVARDWHRPSALEKMTVGGLAAHLAQQIVAVPRILAAPLQGPPIALLEHYSRVGWRGADLDQETNVGIREGSESLAQQGPQTIADQAGETVTQLRELLAAKRPDRAVFLPYVGWALILHDYLITRMMEIAVHSDDLAVSVGIPTPGFPPDVEDSVVGLLTRLAMDRHGANAVIRALSRAERAPASIAGI